MTLVDQVAKMALQKFLTIEDTCDLQCKPCNDSMQKCGVQFVPLDPRRNNGCQKTRSLHTCRPSHLECTCCTLFLHPLSLWSLRQLFLTLGSDGSSCEVCSPISQCSPPPTQGHRSGQSRPPIHCKAGWHPSGIDDQSLGLHRGRERRRKGGREGERERVRERERA